VAGPPLTVGTRARHRAAPPRPHRLFWGLVDQGLVSVAGAVLTVQGARQLAPADFGRLATALACYYVLLSVNRGVVSEVYVLRWASRAGAAGARADAARALRATGHLAAVAALPLAATATVFGPLPIALAAALPVLLLQDVCRGVLIASGLTSRSALSSGTVVAGQLAGGVALHLVGLVSPAGLVLVWAAAAGLGVLASGLLPVPTGAGGGLSWLRDERDRWPRFGVEALAQAGASQLGLLTVAALAGAATVGGLRAATVLLSPLLVLQQSAGQLAVAELSRVPADRRARAGLIGQLGVLALAGCWLGVLLALPAGWLRALVGASLPAAEAALPGMAVFVAAGATVAAPLAALRLAGAARTATRLRLGTAAFPVLLPAVVAAAGGDGAAIATTFGAVALGSALAWTATAARHRPAVR
jgi:hypothetical protein